MTFTRPIVQLLFRSGSPRFGRRGGFAVVAYAFTVTMIGTTLPTPLYPIYRSEFGFSELMVTVIFATYAVGVIAALLLFGHLSDQIGRRRVLLAGLALSALSAVVFLVANGLWLLLVGRILSGLSAGIFTGTATATLADLVPRSSVGRATVVATSANIGGLGCGPLMAGLLAQFAVAPLRLPFGVDLALVIPAMVLVWSIPEPVQAEGRVRLRPQRLRVPPQARPAFVRAGLAAFAGFAVLGLFTAVAPDFLGEVLRIDDHAIVGLVVFAVFAASTAGQTALVVVFRARPLVIGCVGLIAGMGLLALGLALPSLVLVIAGAVVAGLGQGLSFRTGLAAVNQAAPPRQRAEVASSFFVVAYVAISVPVVACGLITQLRGVQVAGLILAAMVAVLASTVLVLLARKSPAVR
ncbi:MFS transporter [Saccharopolyspora pogona]|uniref:MFS transporter n=1 Tax=Saccharopolyspora pogona TaxID=333966 RepID=UPI001681D3FA|nr:MFS transporter [Saccharopolyspora pogona]